MEGTAPFRFNRELFEELLVSQAAANDTASIAKPTSLQN